jgi:putative OPT family oligopeptide transporter
MARVEDRHNPPELTLRAIAIGFAIGLVMTAAITYVALYSGLAISAAIPAAVICTGAMRMFRTRSTLLENNVAQTIASSGEALAVGIVFTIPALVISGVRTDLSYWEVSVTAALGGLLGVLFTIPLRRSLVMESPELPFPESVASAKISRVGDDTKQSLLPALVAVLVGAVFKALSSFVQVVSTTVEGARRIGGAVFYGGMDLSLALVGVGIIVGLEFAVLMLFGGLISWLVAIPLMADPAAFAGHDLVAVAWQTWSSDVRYLGIGAMIVGGCWSIFQARGSISRGVRGAFAGVSGRNARRVDRTDADLPMGMVLAAIALVAAATFVFMTVMVGSVGLAALSTVITVGATVLFCAVAGYIVGQVGNSNNPISGMAICSLLLVSLIFILLRVAVDADLTLTVLLISAFVCAATATAGDTAQHLKSGALLGGTPRRIQLAQLAGVAVFAFVVAPIVVVLLAGYGIGADESGTFKAPQATIFANLADAVFTGAVPQRMLLTGGAIAIALIAMDALLRRRTTSRRAPVMPVAIGMYLPLSLSVPLLVGGLLGRLIRRAGHRTGSDTGYDRAVLLCSGLITGEAIVGLSAAVPRSLGWQIPVPLVDSPILSIAALGLVLAWIVRSTTPPRTRSRITED